MAEGVWQGGIPRILTELLSSKSGGEKRSLGQRKRRPRYSTLLYRVGAGKDEHSQLLGVRNYGISGASYSLFLGVLLDRPARLQSIATTTNFGILLPSHQAPL